VSEISLPYIRILGQEVAKQFISTSFSPSRIGQLKPKSVTHPKGMAGNESAVGIPGRVSDVGENAVPTRTVLREAYPNPFNPSTRLSFDLAKPAQARLNIFDISGRLVNSLVDEQLGAGRHEVVWNERNNAGALVSSGVYLYRFEADDVVQMKRMMLLK
jgi:hypothetical protein